VGTGDDESVGTLVYVSVEQVETLAVDLLEQAHAARRARMQIGDACVTARINLTEDVEIVRRARGGGSLDALESALNAC
jgi:hypothetical protein